jgi:hypothetical protein
MSTTIKTVDFIPTLTITGDLKKSSEYDIALYNTVISAVLTILSMEKGSNQLLPDMGAKDEIMKLFHCEEAAAQGIINNVTGNVRAYTGNDVAIDYSLDTKDPEICHIKISVVGLPGTTVIDVSQTGKFIKTAKPTLFI